MTQQELVNAVNRLTVGYNVSWQDIKYDADKAILKINSYLGSCYPKMSMIMTGPNTTYSYKKDGKYFPIFNDAYISTIIIPYIATEILARDEEFTTIYNKYALEVEDGLFTMFSNEFNRVPPMFKQMETTGVFFADDTEQAIEMNDYYNGPTIKFKVTYHLNRPDLRVDQIYVQDRNEYNFNDEYYILYPTKDGSRDGANVSYYTTNGDKLCTIVGWCYDSNCTVSAYNDQAYNIKGDVDVYARWEDISVFTLNNVYDTVSGNNYKSITLIANQTMKYLSIPRYIRGEKITALDMSFLSNYTSTDCPIDVLEIPDTINIIFANTFNNFKGSKIVFPKQSNLNIKINNYALYLEASKIETTDIDKYPIIIPTSVTTISDISFAFALGDSPDHEPSYDPDIGTDDRIIDILCLWNFNSKPETFTLGDVDDNSIVNKRIFKIGNIIYKIHYVGDPDV